MFLIEGNVSYQELGWKGKDAVKDGVEAFSCPLNCLRVSLLGFSSFCLTLSMMRLTLSGGVHFVRFMGGGGCNFFH